MQKKFKRFQLFVFAIVLCFASNASSLINKDLSQIKFDEQSAAGEILAYYTEMSKEIDAKSKKINSATIKLLIEAANQNITIFNEVIQVSQRGLCQCESLSKETIAQAESLFGNASGKNFLNATRLFVEQCKNETEFKLNTMIANGKLAIEKEQELIAKYNKMKTKKRKS